MTDQSGYGEAGGRLKSEDFHSARDQLYKSEVRAIHAVVPPGFSMANLVLLLSVRTG